MSGFAVLTVSSLAILLGVSCKPALGENNGLYVGASGGISVPNVDDEDIKGEERSLEQTTVS